MANSWELIAVDGTRQRWRIKIYQEFDAARAADQEEGIKIALGQCRMGMQRMECEDLRPQNGTERAAEDDQDGHRERFLKRRPYEIMILTRSTQLIAPRSQEIACFAAGGHCNRH